MHEDAAKSPLAHALETPAREFCFYYSEGRCCHYAHFGVGDCAPDLCFDFRTWLQAELKNNIRRQIQGTPETMSA